MEFAKRDFSRTIQLSPNKRINIAWATHGLCSIHSDSPAMWKIKWKYKIIGTVGRSPTGWWFTPEPDINSDLYNVKFKRRIDAVLGLLINREKLNKGDI